MEVRAQCALLVTDVARASNRCRAPGAPVRSADAAFIQGVGDAADGRDAGRSHLLDGRQDIPGELVSALSVRGAP